MNLATFLNGDENNISNLDPQKQKIMKTILKKVVDDYSGNRNDNPKYAIKQNLEIQYIVNFRCCEDFTKYFQQQDLNGSSS